MPSTKADILPTRYNHFPSGSTSSTIVFCTLICSSPFLFKPPGKQAQMFLTRADASRPWLRGGSSEVELVSAGGAIDLADLGSASALRAGSKDAAAQDEIDDKSDQVGNQHHQQGPENGGHAAAAGIAVNVAEEHNVPGKKEAEDCNSQAG